LLVDTSTRGGERHVYKKVAVNATNSIKLHFLTNKVLDVVKKLLKIAKNRYASESASGSASALL